jgi:cytosine/adenosine deaminase-related metal-dependent hydrolase
MSASTMDGMVRAMSGRTPSFLLRNAAAVWAGAPRERELLTGVDVLLAGNRVERIGAGVTPAGDCRVVDASNWLVVPGFVNAHHHLSQQFTRTFALEGGLVDWLTALYPVWAHVDADIAYHGALTGIGELLLTGVTTVSDFTYFYPRGQTDMFDAQVVAARELGCRFAPVRGGLSELEAAVGARLGDSLDAFVEDRDTFLADASRAIDTYHDRSPASMLRVAVGLAEKAYSSPDLMREVAELAEQAGVRLHTHLHPRPDERRHCTAARATDPVAFLDATGWWTDRLWVAHGTGLLPGEVEELARARVALCTCPSSNARFGTPIAPAWDLHRAGGTVAVGVDGAASNDSGDFLGECRLTWQMQRVRAGTAGEQLEALTPAAVLEWATAGGAAALGWPELGRLEEGGLADIAAFDLSGLDFVGNEDPLSALLLCGIAHRAQMVVVDGRVVVEGGRLVGADEDELTRRAREAAGRLRRAANGARRALTSPARAVEAL